ncbi:MAG: hypothetical protein Q7T55_23475 [Solirubrobacteraceae bacterium]|nr:hypothetical protein [Solirubrobacteraceae bacterium]
MNPPFQLGRQLRALPTLLLMLFVFALGVPATASADVTLSIDDPNPTAGSPVTLTATTSKECVRQSFTYSIDGTALPTRTGQPGQLNDAFTTTVATAGAHIISVSVVYTYGNGTSCGTESDQKTFTFKPAISGEISVTPETPSPGETARIAVAPSGGVGAPWENYRWTINGVAYPAANNMRTFSYAFPTARTYTVAVTFSDRATPAHSRTVTRTVSVQTPTATPTPTPVPTPDATTPTPTPAPGAPTPTEAPSAPASTPVPDVPAPAPSPAPPACARVAFALSEFTTTGCFTKTGSNPDRWETTDQVSLNGITFADSGQRLIITGPTKNEPGGHIKSDNAAIEVDRFIPFSGNMDWSLPAGKAGTEAVLREVSVPSYARLFKLRVAGSISIKLGLTTAGKYYATFPLNVELPPAFTAGPSKFSGGVSGAASIRVDAGGVHYDGLKVEVKDVWLGRLKVPEACISYVPASGQAVEPCKAPEFNGKPYLECATAVDSDRFDASAVVELPTTSQTRLAAFGGLAGGEVSKLGGYVSGLGTSVPIVPGVFLNSLGFGLCLAPPPFKVKGTLGINALGGKLALDGSITYTDATEDRPWAVDVGGDVSFNQTLLGSANVGFNAWGDVTFGLDSKIELGTVGSVRGNVAGWIEPRNDTFNVSGTVQGCLGEGTANCKSATGLLSSTGVAGCIDLGTITVKLPDELIVKESSGGLIRFVVVTRTETKTFRAGLGKIWGGKASTLGNTCDLAPYSAKRSIAARGARATRAQVAAPSLSERIAPGTQAIALRVGGTNGPPKIVLNGPGGATITSPANGTVGEEQGRYVLAENADDGTTNVVLIKPAAGDWTVTAAPGAASTPTTIERSELQAPSVLFGQQREIGGRREVTVQYALPEGASLSLAERGEGIGGTLAKNVRGKRCARTAPLEDGRRLMCARLTFTPSRGPGGKRQIEALVSRDGIPITTKTIATFRASRERLPSRPAKLRARRVGTSVVVALPKVSGASRLSASATLADGRMLGFDLAASCRAVRIPAVDKGDSVRFKVAGVRYDLQTGKYRSVTLKGNRKSTGAKGTFPKQTCR